MLILNKDSQERKNVEFHSANIHKLAIRTYGSLFPKHKIVLGNPNMPTTLDIT